MRTLLGAVVALIAGGALIVVGSITAGIDGMWTMVPVGVVVGIAIRAVVAAKDVSLLRGVLAAIVAVGSMFGGQIVAKEITQRQTPKAGKAAAVAENAMTDGEAGEAGREPRDGIAAIESRLPVQTNGASGQLGGAASTNSPYDAVFLAVGLLLAYQIGKGAAGGAATSGDPAGDDVAADGDAGEPSDGGEPQQA